ncbi:MAG TPA: transcriptional repressor LexA [Candidatus Wunengus sp. YC60]|uniref:transcriptional repressor LexA n=1 Tax=Candidatus Wunengus sp. YC60 TaxID=3367697 RepID=UPI0040277785
MNLPLTKRQFEMLSILYDYIQNTGYPPTFEEMRERLSVTSNQSVIDLLSKLEHKGIIKRNESAARGIAILPLGYESLGKNPLVPFLGVSHAGAPLTAIEIVGNWEPVSREVSRLDAEVFLLKITGDSMINAGIDDGDKVLVKSQKEFTSGDIVYAQIGDESTIKRFISQDKPPYHYLKPENPNYPPIFFTSTVEMKGKVISILKAGQWRTVSETYANH